MIPNIGNFPEGNIIAFALIFLRIIPFVIVWPIFGSSFVPIPVKLLLSLILSVVLYPVVQKQNVDLMKISETLVFLSAREIAVGIFLGFLLRFFFFAVSIGGEMIGVSSGLSSAQLFNPALGSQTNILEQAQVIIATLFMLSVNGHHLFINGLAQSFEIIPLSDIGLKYQGFVGIGLFARGAFLVGIKMALPVIMSVFVVNLFMGLLGRAVPQMNVMMTSFQVSIIVCIIVFFMSIPLLVDQMNELLQMMAESFFSAMKVL